jgi:SAM-dependent methyltransferase
LSANLIKYIPPGTRKILELGCANGGLGHMILEKGLATEYVGIEIRPAEADEARKRLTAVFCADGENLELPYPENYFDCLIYGDSIEHLRDPEKVLACHVRLLKPGGMALCSIPNVRNLFVVDQLLHGEWTYTDWGLLDRTHLRFFTLGELKKLFPRAGLEILQVECSLREGSWFSKMNPSENIRPDFVRLYDSMQQKMLRGEDVRGQMGQIFPGLSLEREEASEFFAVQFHIQAQKPTGTLPV